ncbi:MAG: aromatic amino acid lyase, partial [Proteiniphilum sp.]|nr:aromatic amino acid lyase [Proteiniphilum sp.]
NIRRFLEGSELISRKKEHLQDPYSFRCVPQVHGATKDAIDYVEQVVVTEINSVTDNPTIFPDDDEIISGGNFHGQPLAIAFDFLSIALAELGNISERRTAQLILGKRGLPEFLVASPGLNSGFMIPQYVAASVVSQNKMYSYAASTDSIVSSNGQEDHVSMGATSAIKLLPLMDNLDTILSIEMMNAVQALDFRRPLRSSPLIEKVVKAYRKEVPFIEEDIAMYKEIRKTVSFLNRLDVDGL